MEPIDDFSGAPAGGGDGLGGDGTGGDNNGWNAVGGDASMIDDPQFYSSLWFLLILFAILLGTARYSDRIKDFIFGFFREKESAIDEKAQRYKLSSGEDLEEGNRSMGSNLSISGAEKTKLVFGQLKNLAEKSKDVVKHSIQMGKDTIQSRRKKNDTDIGDENDTKLLSGGDGTELDDDDVHEMTELKTYSRSKSGSMASMSNYSKLGGGEDGVGRKSTYD